MERHAGLLTRPKVEMDAGLKGLVALILAIAASRSSNGWELLCFALYLLIITILLRNDLGFIKKNLASFGLVFVLPYSLGLLLSLLATRFFPGAVYTPHISVEVTFFKMAKLFFIWYIGSLYFFTTPFPEIAMVLNRLLRPLNSIGVPVTKHLNMVNFTVDQLAQSIDRFQADTMEAARKLFKDHDCSIKTRLGALADLVVGLIVDSLQTREQVQDEFEQSAVPAGRYQMRILKNDVVALLSLIIFLGVFCSAAQVELLFPRL